MAIRKNDLFKSNPRKYKHGEAFLTSNIQIDYTIPTFQMTICAEDLWLFTNYFPNFDAGLHLQCTCFKRDTFKKMKLIAVDTSQH